MSLPSLLDRDDAVDVCAVEAVPDDWRKPIMQYLDNPNGKHDRKTRVHATNYVMYQNELYRKGKDGLLLLCLGLQESARSSSIRMENAMATSTARLFLAKDTKGLYRVCTRMRTVPNPQAYTKGPGRIIAFGHKAMAV
ncbi:hypothetical protein ACFX2J_010882 [Malus domestica]